MPETVVGAAGEKDGETMKKFLILMSACLSAAFAAAGGASSAAAAPVPKALVVMVDGLRADALENAGASNLLALAAGRWQRGYKSAWTLTAQTIADAPSSSAPNHAAILLGVTASKSNIYSNSLQFANCDFKKYPSFLARIADARAGAKTVFFYSWKADGKLCPHPKVEYVYSGDLVNAGYRELARAQGEAPARDLAEGRELAKRLASASCPDAAVLFLDLPDWGGHKLLGGAGDGFYPYGTAYLRSVRLCDGIIGRCLDAIARRPTFAGEDWLVIVTSDHGGYLHTHGIKGGHATTVPLIVSSRHVGAGRLAGTPVLCDIAPTVLRHFGIDTSAFDLDGTAVGAETCVERPRPLRDGLAVYLPFDTKKIVNAVPGGPQGIVRGRATRLEPQNGCFRGGLSVAPDAHGAGGVCLKGSESLTFENGGDFAVTLWTRIDDPQPADTLLIANKDWRSGNNPGVALSAAKRTESVATRGVVFNCVTASRRRVDTGTYNVTFGAWTFYAVTRGADGVIRLYQGAPDGRLYCIAEDARALALTTGLPFYVGQDGTGRYRWTLKGRIDDLALWTRTLSHADVKRIFAAGRQGGDLGDLLADERARVGGN
jgi:hypothetical protein